MLFNLEETYFSFKYSTRYTGTLSKGLLITVTARTFIFNVGELDGAFHLFPCQVDGTPHQLTQRIHLQPRGRFYCASMLTNAAQQILGHFSAMRTHECAKWQKLKKYRYPN
jgi:hypothetical protein